MRAENFGMRCFIKALGLHVKSVDFLIFSQLEGDYK
jgi:hypothetical protein